MLSRCVTRRSLAPVAASSRAVTEGMHEPGKMWRWMKSTERLLSTCDRLVELGPGGGIHGGQLMTTGTPEALAADPSSLTGPFLQRELDRARKAAKPVKRAKRSKQVKPQAKPKAKQSVKKVAKPKTAAKAKPRKRRVSEGSR